MNPSLLKQLEEGIILIGNKLCMWRDDPTSRQVLEPKAFKTKADQKAHDLIKKLIEGLFPYSIVLSEEDVEERWGERPSRYWLIDPIDGTASWYDGFDGFVTQLAYIENNVPIYGAVYAPVFAKLWTAYKGKGAYLNGVQLPRLAQNFRLILIDNYPRPTHIAEKVSLALPITQYIECGSLGLKSCMVIDGSADLFVKDVVVRDWDIAPIAVLINEVGGVMVDLDGNAIEFHGSFEKEKGLIVARDQALVDSVVRMAADL